MKLMLLIIPTIQTTVNPIANGPSSRMTPGPNGLLTSSTMHIQADRERGPARAGRELPASA